MTATAADYPQPGEVIEFSNPDIPKFETKNVALTKAKITSVAGLEIGDLVWGVDEFVRLTVETRVTAVLHQVNQTTGKLERVHVLKAMDCKVLPWDD